MLRSAFTVVVLLSGAACFAGGGPDDKAAPKELVQYVLDAQKAGIKSPQIRQNAVKAGWPEGLVDSALESALGSTKPAEPETPPASTPPAANAPAPMAENSASKGATFEAAVRTQPEKISEPYATPATPATGTPGNPAAAPPATPASGDSASLRAKAAEGARGGDYLIGEGDVLQISVWGEPTASVGSVTVRPDGKITLPLIKEIVVSGLTPSQLEASVQEQLSKVIRAPDVAVIVVQINSKKIFLTGAVKKEGPLKYTYRMTVLQAISEAGGLTDYAKRKKIYILHTEDGRQFRHPFDYTAVLKGENMEQNIILSPGDTIVVP